MYLTRGELHARVGELGREISRDYDGREPLLVAPLKASLVFLADLTRALDIPHGIDFVTLLDRPYRRLVEDLPVRYVGFTVPDELFVGYGFDLEERYRNLPDLHVLRS